MAVMEWDLQKLAIAHGLYPFKRRDTNRPRRIDTLRRHLLLSKIGAPTGQVTPGPAPTTSGVAISTTKGLTKANPPSGSTSFSRSIFEKGYQQGEFRGFTTPKQMRPKGTRLSDLGVPPPIPSASTATTPNISEDPSKLAQYGQVARPALTPVMPQLAGVQPRGLQLQQPEQPEPGTVAEAPPPEPESEPGRIVSDTQQAAQQAQEASQPGPNKFLQWMAENPTGGAAVGAAAFGLPMGAAAARTALTAGRAAGMAGSELAGSVGGAAARGAVGGPIGAGLLGAEIGGNLGASYLYPLIKTKLGPGEMWSDQPTTSTEMEQLLSKQYVPGEVMPEMKEEAFEGKAGLPSWRPSDWAGRDWKTKPDAGR